MPLKEGKSKQVISENIKTLMHEYKDEGHIGKSHPQDKKAAQKQAVAISMTKAGVSKKQTQTNPSTPKKSSKTKHSSS